MTRRLSWMLGILLLAALTVHAADIQYLLATGQVTGTGESLTIAPLAGYGIVTIAEPVSAIVWPAPSGCTVGFSTWTTITNPAGVTAAGAGMTIRADLAFFHTTSPLLTGCHAVVSKGQVKALMDQAIITAANSLETLINALAGVNTWKNELCPPTNNNANCITWRAQADTVNARYPSRTQGATLATDMATLVNDGYTFIAAQCTATPGGPFC